MQFGEFYISPSLVNRVTTVAIVLIVVSGVTIASVVSTVFGEPTPPPPPVKDPVAHCVSLSLSTTHCRDFLQNLPDSYLPRAEQ